MVNDTSQIMTPAFHTFFIAYIDMSTRINDEGGLLSFGLQHLTSFRSVARTSTVWHGNVMYSNDPIKERTLSLTSSQERNNNDLHCGGAWRLFCWIDAEMLFLCNYWCFELRSNRFISRNGKGVFASCVLRDVLYDHLIPSHVTQARDTSLVQNSVGSKGLCIFKYCTSSTCSPTQGNYQCFPVPL